MSSAAEAIDYEKLATMIEERLARQSSPGQLTWNSKECAEYFKCSVENFRDRIAKKHTFPATIRGAKCKWFKQDVVEWSRGNR